MIISESQKKQLQTLFNALPSDLKGHSIRTGITLQIFVSKISTVAPKYLSKEASSGSMHIIHCAREFGFYHHLGDSLKISEGSSGISAARKLILPIFKGSWNSNGYYAIGLLDTIENHCEKWDGSGCPKGLSGTDIPFWGRACAIAEQYDLICSRQPRSNNTAMKELIRLAGKSLDPDLVSIFKECSDSLRILKT
ncbi:MAG TPA: HD domain-containing phosphohydrolase [Lachnospiraceae bacterium]|nr:HD domain-containing phosphohydrolase [Lachnospiraceae bacterium]